MSTTPLSTSPTAQASSTSPTLAELKPVDMTPEWRAAKTPTKTLLSIDHVEVVKAQHQEGTTGTSQVYIVNVYMAHKSKDEPDFQVLHTVSQFCSLRNNVHACVQRGHQGARCQFCERLARFVTFGEGGALSFAAIAFSPKTDASRLLIGFLSEALRQSQLGLQTLQSTGCRGQHQLPRLLQAFLFQSPQQ